VVVRCGKVARVMKGNSTAWANTRWPPQARCQNTHTRHLTFKCFTIRRNPDFQTSSQLTSSSRILCSRFPKIPESPWFSLFNGSSFKSNRIEDGVDRGYKYHKENEGEVHIEGAEAVAVRLEAFVPTPWLRGCWSLRQRLRARQDLLRGLL